MTKSNNQKGNPYHDENGQFTSAENQGQGGSFDYEKKENNANVPNTKQIKLKAGVDVNEVKQKVSQMADPLNSELSVPKTIQEAQQQGNKIIGSQISVGYDDSTDPLVAHQFNLALRDIARDFKEIMVGDNIWIYGTKNNRASSMSDIQKSIQSVLLKPENQQRLTALGLDQNDLYSIMKGMTDRTLAYESGYNQNTLQKGCGGSTGFIEGQGKSTLVVGGSSVKFNTIYSQSAQSFSDYPTEAIKEGHFLPIGDKDGAYMVAVHELGHHVFEKLKSMFDDNEKAELEKVLTNGKGYSAFTVIPNSGLAAAIFGPFERNDYEQLKNQGDISGYATYSQHEHVAEAFANVYCAKDQATQHNKNIVKFLKGVYNRIYGSK